MSYGVLYISSTAVSSRTVFTVEFGNFFAMISYYWYTHALRILRYAGVLLYVGDAV